MTYNASIGFGSGFLFMTPLQGSNLTPVRVGLLQDVSFDISWDEKPLYGQNQWAFAIANGKAKGSIKAKNAIINSTAIGSIILGVAPVAGQEIVVDLEAAAVPDNPGPYTVQVAGHATITQDLGVFYAATGQPLTQVPSGQEASGKYSVSVSGGSKGTYTFGGADAIAAVLISYAKNDGATGLKTSVTNQPMGTSSYFQTDLYQSNPEAPGSQWGLRLYRCKSSKLSLQTKQDDWTIPEFDASIQANAAGKVLDFNSPN